MLLCHWSCTVGRGDMPVVLGAAQSYDKNRQNAEENIKSHSPHESHIQNVGHFPRFSTLLKSAVDPSSTRNRE